MLRTQINRIISISKVNRVTRLSFSSLLESEVNPTAAFRKEHSIRMKGVEDENAYPPITDFIKSPFLQPIKNILTKAGYVSPTPIQAQAWPIAMSKRDMISVAKTGSGKTCAYLLPAIHELMTNKKDWAPNHVSVFILAPTRELCLQIMDQVNKYTGSTVATTSSYGRDRDRPSKYASNSGVGINAIACYGGSDRLRQIRQLQRNNVQIVVGTPGRCNDLLEAGVLNLKNVKYCVLDEADRMLDMGFEPQISQLLQETDREKRQTLCFTATWPREVQNLALSYLKSPVQLNIGDSDLLTANSSIVQHIKFVQEHDKMNILDNLLKELKSEFLIKQESMRTADTAATTNTANAAGNTIQPSYNHNNKFLQTRKTEPKIILFTSRKASCDEICFYLTSKGYNNVNSLHGDKSQGMRDKVMQSFRKGYCNYLVATDVAARGLDISDIDIVINIDMPQNIEDYVHRIGRTARGTNSGLAYTFFTKYDSKLAKDLVGVMTRSKQEVPEELQQYLPRHRDGRDGGNSRGFGRSSGGYGNRSGGRDRDRGYGNDSRRYGNSEPRQPSNRYGNDSRPSCRYGGNSSGGYGNSSGGRSRSNSFDSPRNNSYNSDRNSFHREGRDSSRDGNRERVIDLNDDHLSENYVQETNASLGFQEQSDLYMNHKSNSNTSGPSGRPRARSSSSSSSGGSRSGFGRSRDSNDFEEDAAYDKYRNHSSNHHGASSGTGTGSYFKKVHIQE